VSSAGQEATGSQRPASPRACPALPVNRTMCQNVPPAVQQHTASRLQPLGSHDGCTPLQQQQWPGLSDD
jgi:hypothetical protein